MPIKLLIQINCLNEEESLPIALADLPKKIEGIDKIEVLIVDDGSRDRTVEVAKKLGVQHVLSHSQNRGLPAAVNSGIQYAIHIGADILVNTDADNQYNAQDIEKLVRPILEGRADVVYGERPIFEIAHFSKIKKLLQWAGAKVVAWVAGENLNDAASGFRALNREAICRLYLLGDYASPLEIIIQSKMKKLGFSKVPVRVNADLRPSRIFKSKWKYVVRSGAIILDNLLIYRPLQIFFSLGIVFFLSAIGITTYRLSLIKVSSDDHLTLLIISIVGYILGIQLMTFGLAARLSRASKLVNDEIFYRQNLGRNLESNPSEKPPNPNPL